MNTYTAIKIAGSKIESLQKTVGYSNFRRRRIVRLRRKARHGHQPKTWGLRFAGDAD